MTFIDECKADVEAIKQRIVESSEDEQTDASMKFKKLHKAPGTKVGMLAGALAEGWKRK